MSSGIWLADITDHLPVYLILPHEVIKHHERSIYIEKRFYSEDRINNFKDEIRPLQRKNILPLQKRRLQIPA